MNGTPIQREKPFWASRWTEILILALPLLAVIEASYGAVEVRIFGVYPSAVVLLGVGFFLPFFFGIILARQAAQLDIARAEQAPHRYLSRWRNIGIIRFAVLATSVAVIILYTFPITSPIIKHPQSIPFLIVLFYLPAIYSELLPLLFSQPDNLNFAKIWLAVVLAGGNSASNFRQVLKYSSRVLRKLNSTRIRRDVISRAQNLNADDRRILALHLQNSLRNSNEEVVNNIATSINRTPQEIISRTFGFEDLLDLLPKIISLIGAFFALILYLIQFLHTL